MAGWAESGIASDFLPTEAKQTAVEMHINGNMKKLGKRSKELAMQIGLV